MGDIEPLMIVDTLENVLRVFGALPDLMEEENFLIVLGS